MRNKCRFHSNINAFLRKSTRDVFSLFISYFHKIRKSTNVYLKIHYLTIFIFEIDLKKIYFENAMNCSLKNLIYLYQIGCQNTVLFIFLVKSWIKYLSAIFLSLKLRLLMFRFVNWTSKNWTKNRLEIEKDLKSKYQNIWVQCFETTNYPIYSRLKCKNYLSIQIFTDIYVTSRLLNAICTTHFISGKHDF